MLPDSNLHPTVRKLLESHELAEVGRWSEALRTVREGVALDPENVLLREFELEALVRLGCLEEARRLLAPLPDHELSREGKWLKQWLSSPPRSHSVPDSLSTVVHPLYGTTRFETAKITVVGELDEELRRTLVDFHRREFNGHELLFQCATLEVLLPSFEELRIQLQVGGEPEWLEAVRADGDVVLVIARTALPTAYSAGFGAPGCAVVGLQSGDPFQATVVAHELYHSLLDLNHTNGAEGPLDPGSIMGPLGLRAPLTHTYLAEEHRRFCLTTPEVQALVEREKQEEALRLDPNYLALYSTLATRYLQKRLPDRALAALRTWFKKDPGPEAAAALGKLLMDLGEDPGSTFLRSRGHGEAANTHLYLAQACLDSFRFEAAVTELERAYTLEPSNLNLRGMLGWAHHGCGNLAAARKLYAETLSLNEEWEAIRARVRWIEGQPYEAPYPDPDLLWIQSYCEDAPSALKTLAGQTDQRCVLRRARALLGEGRLQEARTDFDFCISTNPYTLPARVSDAWRLYLDGSPKAQEALRSNLKVWPNYPCALALERLMR